MGCPGFFSSGFCNVVYVVRISFAASVTSHVHVPHTSFFFPFFSLLRSARHPINATEEKSGYSIW